MAKLGIAPMSRLRVAIATTVLLLSAGAVQAADRCGAQTHMRFGETRAYFGDTLAACRPDGYCSAVVALPDPSGQAVYRQQLRVARPSPGADHLVELVAANPMPVASPMRFTTPGQTVDPGPWLVPTSPGANEFRVSDPILTRSLVSGLRRQRIARWTYPSADGPVEAYFSLRGMTAALNWIDCRGAAASG
jgi:hypothetical protein